MGTNINCVIDEDFGGDSPPISLAAFNCCFEVVKLFVEKGAVLADSLVFETVGSSLPVADRFKVTAFLIEHGARLGPQPDSHMAMYGNALVQLCFRMKSRDGGGNESMIRRLLTIDSVKAVIDAKTDAATGVNDNRATALHAAIYSGCVGRVAVLLNHGADPLNATANGVTVEQYALALSVAAVEKKTAAAAAVVAAEVPEATAAKLGRPTTATTAAAEAARKELHEATAAAAAALAILKRVSKAARAAAAAAVMSDPVAPEAAAAAAAPEAAAPEAAVPEAAVPEAAAHEAAAPEAVVAED
jgi:hypothetical protein